MKISPQDIYDKFINSEYILIYNGDRLKHRLVKETNRVEFSFVFSWNPLFVVEWKNLVPWVYGYGFLQFLDTTGESRMIEFYKMESVDVRRELNAKI